MGERKIKLCPRCGKRPIRKTHGWCSECHAANMREVRDRLRRVDVSVLSEATGDALEQGAIQKLKQLKQERDAARAVVEDVDGALDHGIDDAEDGVWPCGLTRGEAVAKLRRERDEARAAVLEAEARTRKVEAEAASWRGVCEERTRDHAEALAEVERYRIERDEAMTAPAEPKAVIRGLEDEVASWRRIYAEMFSRAMRAEAAVAQVCCERDEARAEVFRLRAEVARLRAEGPHDWHHD